LSCPKIFPSDTAMPQPLKVVSQNWFEKVLLAGVLGGIAPIGFLLCGWWGSYLVLPEKYILLFALAGLGLGFLLDILFLHKWLGMAYRFHPIILVAIYLFYSVGMFGFFMGVPVFNTILGPLAGYYTGRRIQVTNPPNKKSIIRWVSVFTSVVLAVACLAAILLAAGETTLSSNINGMLYDLTGLKTTLDNQAILNLSMLAGVGIVIVEYFCTKAAATIIADF
jgi:hypothetical protein